MGKHPVNLALRFILEMAALVIFSILGWKLTANWWRVLPAVLIPLFFTLLWSVFAVKDDPSRSGKTVVPTRGIIRLIFELFFFTLAVLALFDMGFKTPGIVFAIAVVFHYIISYDRIIWLLKN